MGKCVIFCAGDFDGRVYPGSPEDFLIAADGGLRYVQALGLTPDLVLGDFDSLGYVPEGALRYPVEKDDTDAMLAVRRGLDLGFRDFLLYGCLGGPRLDHTVAAFQTLGYLAEHGAAGYLVGNTCLATVLKNGTLEFPPARGTLSVFCLGPDASGVSLWGLGYELENAVLTAGFPLGCSNKMIGKTGVIRVKSGSLLVIWDRKIGFPKGRIEDGQETPPPSAALH